MKNIILYFTCVLFFVACKNDNKSRLEITSFDISSDGNFIVFSQINSDNKSSLYKSRIDGSDIQLLANKNNYSFFYPKITQDGKKIFFIGSNKNKMESSIWKIDIVKPSIEKIFEEKGFISEIILSKFNNNILYIKAKDYTSYSPIASKGKHDFDIYSMNIDSLNSKKISDLNAYSLSNIIEIDENKLLISQRGTEIENGIFFYNKNFKSELIKIETTNDTLRNSTGYTNPVLLDSHTLVCASYFQLMKIDLETKLEKQILSSNGYHFKQINYNKKLDRLFFIKRDKSNNLYSININGEDFKQTALKN